MLSRLIDLYVEGCCSACGKGDRLLPLIVLEEEKASIFAGTEAIGEGDEVPDDMEGHGDGRDDSSNEVDDDENDGGSSLNKPRSCKEGSEIGDVALA